MRIVAIAFVTKKYSLISNRILQVTKPHANPYLKYIPRDFTKYLCLFLEASLTDDL